MTKKICVVIGSRANYSQHQIGHAGDRKRIRSLNCRWCVGASAILDRYGSVVELIEARRLHAASRACTC